MYYNLGALMEKMEGYSDAQLAYEQAIELDPDYTDVHFNLTFLYKKAGRMRDAEAAIRKAIELDPKNAWSYLRLGDILAEDPRRHKESQAAYGNAESRFLVNIKSNPTKTESYSDLSTFLVQHRRFAEAIPVLIKWLELFPNEVMARIELAGIYRRIGDVAHLEENAVRARAMIYSNDYYNLACLESICGNTDKAFEYLKLVTQEKKTDREWIWKDADLEWIRDDPRFREIVGELPTTS